MSKKVTIAEIYGLRVSTTLALNQGLKVFIKDDLISAF
jgi:hypothetical protein